MGEQKPIKFAIELDPAKEVGTFADFAHIWNTPATFVLDFLSIRTPLQEPQPGSGDSEATVNAKVAARIRIPAEQIFPLIAVLQTQSEIWLKETGRSEPPTSWFTDNAGN